jgi:hydrogenase maturation protease
MVRILIVGIGNPLRSDDGLGWHVARELLRELARGLAHDDLQVVATQQLTPEISDMASRAELVLFIDAARSGNPGILKCEQITPAAPTSRHSHDLSPAGILKLAQDLYGRCPASYILTVAGESFATGDSLSAKVTATIPTLKARLWDFIDGSAGKKIE